VSNGTFRPLPPIVLNAITLSPNDHSVSISFDDKLTYTIRDWRTWGATDSPTCTLLDRLHTCQKKFSNFAKTSHTKITEHQPSPQPLSRCVTQWGICLPRTGPTDGCPVSHSGGPRGNLRRHRRLPNGCLVAWRIRTF